MKKTEVLKTNSFYFAVFLYTLGYQLIRIERNSETLIFVFEIYEDRDVDRLTKYWELLVLNFHWYEFLENLKVLKDFIESNVS